MRFRARIARERFASFWNYIAPLDKVGKEAVLVLSKDSLRLIVLPPGETVMLYSSVIADRALFQEFRVESKAGSIALQVVVANLEQGLQPALEGRAELVTLKLTKRGVPLPADAFAVRGVVLNEVVARTPVIGAAGAGKK